MENIKKKSVEDEFDLEAMKYFIDLPPAEKLRHLEELNNFLRKTMPPENLEISKILKAQGF